MLSFKSLTAPILVFLMETDTLTFKRNNLNDAKPQDTVKILSGRIHVVAPSSLGDVINCIVGPSGPCQDHDGFQ
jgi:hypothetical protein